jgi:PRC-barrel domain
VVVDRSGQVRAAIIDFGGFLGIGNRKIAIDWNALHHFATPEDDRITLDLTRDQVNYRAHPRLYQSVSSGPS